jgi:hypothetical protein
MMYEYGITCDSMIQIPHPMASGSLTRRWYKDSEALHSNTRLAPAKVIEPDQAEAQKAIRVQRVFGCSDYSQACRSFPKECSGIAGTQAMVKVRFGAQFNQAPIRKLAQQRTAKSLPIFQSCAAPAGFPVGGMREIH